MGYFELLQATIWDEDDQFHLPIVSTIRQISYNYAKIFNTSWNRTGNDIDSKNGGSEYQGWSRVANY